MEFTTLKDFKQYEITTDGVIRNKRTGKILKPTTVCFGGYKTVGLYDRDTKKTVIRRVHRLVADTFIPNPDNLPEVDHIDHDKFNNNVNNLRWVTKRENLLSRDWCKPVVMCDKKTKSWLKLFKTTTAAAEWLSEHQNKPFGATRVGICQCCRNERHSAFGYSWCYSKDYKFFDDYSDTAKDAFIRETEELKD